MVGKREMKYRVAKRKSKSPPLDLLKIQHTTQNNGWLVTCQMAGRIKFSSDIPRFGLSNTYNFKFSNAVNYLHISQLVDTVNRV